MFRLIFIIGSCLLLAPELSAVSSAHINACSNGLTLSNRYIHLRNSLPGVFIELANAGAFIDQMDVRYREIVRRREHGICASICIANTTLALKGYLGALFSDSFDILRMILAGLSDPSHNFIVNEIHRGLYPAQTFALLGFVFKNYRMNHWSGPRYVENVRIRLIEEPLMAAFEQSTVLEKKPIWIGNFYGSRANGSAAAHAVIILDIDIENKTVLLSDPNESNILFFSHYEVLPDGSLQLTKDFNLEGILKPRLKSMIEIAPQI